jgi:hypothetical protein
MDTPKVLSGSAKVIAGEAIDEKGIMIAMKADGEAYKAADAADILNVVGLNDEVVEEDEIIVAKSGIYGLTNSATDPVAAADIGNAVYVEDEGTIAKTDPANGVIAGTLRNVDANHAWVEIAQ